MSDYEIPKKIERYIKRVAADCTTRGENDLANLLNASNVEVRAATAYDNWNGGMDGHDVIFDVPDEYMQYIPLDNQSEIQNRIATDLNQAATAASSEYINAVHFEFSGETTAAPDGVTIRRIWKRDAIKLFISHRDKDKKYAHDLTKHLERFGISTFVAHDSIEPDEEWQNEIERALQSMDAMLAVLTEGFFDSPWTNQEIGYALGRGIPIISIKLTTVDPMGFIGSRQAIKVSRDDQQLASALVWETLKKRLSGTGVIAKTLITRFLESRSFEDARKNFNALSDASPNLSQADVDAITSAFNRNSQLRDCWYLTTDNRLLDFLNKYSPKTLALDDGAIKPAVVLADDEIPF